VDTPTLIACPEKGCSGSVNRCKPPRHPPAHPPLGTATSALNNCYGIKQQKYVVYALEQNRGEVPKTPNTAK